MKKYSFLTKILSLATVLVLGLSLIAAGYAEDAPQDLLAEIQSRGKLLVGTEGTWAPYTFHDSDEKLVGFDVEVAQLIAEHLGVEVEYVETVWSSIFGALDGQQIDTVVNEVSFTEERAEKYDFSNPYTYTQRAILVKADNDEINSLEDIQGKIASNDPTSTIGQFALDHGATLDPVGEMAQSINEVLNGRADLTVNTTVSFADYLKQQPDAESKVKIIVVTDPAPSGYIPVRKGETRLVDAINEALKQLQDSGKLTELSIKYFDIDITKE
ncbi:MAG: transporter substrate-binding domain-containing protein [Clostridia bacterium]|nr:transporter substrate-binding domain-containing protein [Clostridia bacterium]